MDIKYFVRTTGERKFNYDLDYELILDTEHKPVDTFINSFYLMNDYNSVLMEDDLVLCKNFKEEIEKVIAQYPNCIINFFTNPFKYFTTHFTTSFNYNQCTYFPKGLSSKLADEMKKVHARTKSRLYGMVLAEALVRLGIPHLVYRPSLVQHIDGKSVLTKGEMYFRNTIYFKDYLDKLNIKMEDAFTLENQKKLNELLKADRDVWYKDILKEVNNEIIRKD